MIEMKYRTRAATRARLFGATLVLLSAGACAASDPTSVEPPEQDADLQVMLTLAIQDEYRAEAIYEGVTADFGPVSPFSNIIAAEVRHSSALATLFAARGWDVPESTSTLANVPHFGSVGAACAAGVEAEIDNAGLYDELMTPGLPADVATVFANNQAASLERHLPAFQRCAY